MTTLEKKVNTSILKNLGIDNLLSEFNLIKAIDSNNEDSLRDLLLDTFRILKENSIKLDNFYYASHMALSEERFDMFSSSGIEELFSLYGYKTELVKDDINIDEWIGKMKIFNDNIEIKLFAVESMHDSLISIFIDTKVSKYIKKQVA